MDLTLFIIFFTLAFVAAINLFAINRNLDKIYRLLRDERESKLDDAS
jgi:hypothetical protein